SQGYAQPRDLSRDRALTPSAPRSATAWADDEHDEDLHAVAADHANHAQGGAGVAAALAQHRFEHVRGPVEHLRLVGEALFGGDESEHQRHPLDAVQVADDV